MGGGCRLDAELKKRGHLGIYGKGKVGGGGAQKSENSLWLQDGQRNLSAGEGSWVGGGKKK